MILLAISAFLLLVLVTYQVRFVLRRRALARRSWEDVLARVQPIDLDGVRSIAACYLHPDRHQLSIEPSTMWERMGGLEGLNRLRGNASVMLELAVFAERWNEEEGPVISEMIRRDAVRLNRALTHVELTLVLHVGLVRAPFYLQEVSASYFLMRSRLLGLYQNSHVALLPRLEAAL